MGTSGPPRNVEAFTQRPAPCGTSAGVLTIKGERKLENEEKKENYHRVELS